MLQIPLTHFVEKVGAIPGAVAEPHGKLHAYHLDPSVVTENAERIMKLLAELVSEATQGEDEGR